MAADVPADILLSQRFLPEHGGSVRWMYEVYRRWPRPVHVITHNYYDYPPRIPEFPQKPPRPAKGDDVEDPNLTMDRHDIFLHDWGLQSLHNLRRYARITGAVRRQLRHSRQTIVHCTHVLPEVFGLIPLHCLGRHRLTVVCYAHGEEITACCSSRQLRFMMRRSYRHVDLLLANSRYTSELASQHLNESRIRVVHPGVHMPEFEGADEAGARWRKQAGFEDRIIVLTVGRLDPRKNHAAVIEAVRGLVGRFPNLLYVVAGEGRQLTALQQQVARGSIEQHILFLGRVHADLKRALFGACDVFAMPAVRDGTDVEGFGIVFLEAGACGKPAISGRAGGQAEAVKDGQTGLVVDGEDQQAVTSALSKLLGDAGLRRRLGECGRNKAREHDWQHVAEQTYDLVETLRSS